MPKTRKMNRYKKKRGGMEAAKSAAEHVQGAVDTAKKQMQGTADAAADAAKDAATEATEATEVREVTEAETTGAATEEVKKPSFFDRLIKFFKISPKQTGGRRRKTKKGRTSKRTKKHGRRKRKTRR
jgi:hypothetical protein